MKRTRRVPRPTSNVQSQVASQKSKVNAWGLRKAVIWLALLSGCSSSPVVEDPFSPTEQLMAEGLTPENHRRWDEWIERLTDSAEVSVDARIALGRIFLDLYRRREQVERLGPEMDSLEGFLPEGRERAGRPLLAEASWYFASVVAENVMPADRHAAMQGLIESLEEKSRSLTATVASGIPDEHRKPLTEVKQRFLWLGMAHLEIVFMSSHYAATGTPEELARLRKSLERHAEVLESIAGYARLNKAFKDYFLRRCREERAMVTLEAAPLQKMLSEEPWKVPAFTRMSAEMHRKQGSDAKTQVMTLRNQGQSPVQIFEQMEKALLHDLFLVEATCMVHREDDVHEGSISDAALDEARGALDWILGVAETSIGLPE